MPVEIIPYGGWKRNVRLSNDSIELIVTLDVGPRIVRCGFKGKRNLFGEFPEQMGKSGSQWTLWGGHRIWVAPESKPLTYEQDNEPVGVEEIANGIRTTQKPGPLTGIRKIMEVRLSPGKNEAQVAHILKNETGKTVECSPWALSVMASEGTAIIPLPPIVKNDDRCSPNQNWSIWRYTDLADPRWRFGSKYILLKQDPARGAAKLGLAQREGWAAYWVDGYLFVIRFERDDRRVYPDGNVNFETYTDDRILELETLGPLVKLAPGDSVKHEERWSLHQNVAAFHTEQDVDKTVLPLIEKP